MYAKKQEKNKKIQERITRVGYTHILSILNINAYLVDYMVKKSTSGGPPEAP